MRRCPRGSEGIFHLFYAGRRAKAIQGNSQSAIALFFSEPVPSGSFSYLSSSLPALPPWSISSSCKRDYALQSRGRMGRRRVFTVSTVLGPVEGERCQTRPRFLPASTGLLLHHF